MCRCSFQVEFYFLFTSGYNLEDKEVDILITIVDHDKNNKIDFGEFLHLVATLETEEKREVDGK